MLRGFHLLILLLPLSILSAQCERQELPTGPHCDCVCSNERVPACYQRQRDDCPPNPACTSHEECEEFCQSDELCAESQPKYARCDFDRGQNTEVFCVQIPQCGEVTEAECRERFEPFGCEFEWLFYRLCVSQEGCDSAYCNYVLEGWENCEAKEAEASE